MLPKIGFGILVKMVNVNPPWAVLLAAGVGSRLQPLTQICPKCLMPVHGRPLLEYWLLNLRWSKFEQIIVNTHHHAEQVNLFLERECFSGWVYNAHEPSLLGTASTLRGQAETIGERALLVAHADNWCHADLRKFREFHDLFRPAGTVMTMMTFDTRSPSICGIVELDEQGVVNSFFEKVRNPPGKVANGAVYILEPEVLRWIRENPWASDFSTQVIPAFLGRIATWHNNNIHRDIGVLEALLDAQRDPLPAFEEERSSDSWSEMFKSHPIHNEIRGLTEQI